MSEKFNEGENDSHIVVMSTPPRRDEPSDIPELIADSVDEALSIIEVPIAFTSAVICCKTAAEKGTWGFWCLSCLSLAAGVAILIHLGWRRIVRIAAFIAPLAAVGTFIWACTVDSLIWAIVAVAAFTISCLIFKRMSDF